MRTVPNHFDRANDISPMTILTPKTCNVSLQNAVCLYILTCAVYLLLMRSRASLIASRLREISSLHRLILSLYPSISLLNRSASRDFCSRSDGLRSLLARWIKSRYLSEERLFCIRMLEICFLQPSISLFSCSMRSFCRSISRKYISLLTVP